MSTTLVIMGCAVFVVLGAGHAALTAFTRKFEPRDKGLLEQLKAGKTSLSKTGNLWNGIQGFHLSHSLGLVVFGGFYITLAIENSAYLQSSTALNVGLLLVPMVYVILAHRFWFSVPRDCFVAAVGLLAASIILR